MSTQREGKRPPARELNDPDSRRLSMKRQPEVGKHILAGMMLVLCAALWNVHYHQEQRNQEEPIQARSNPERHTWRNATPKEREAAIRSIMSQLEAFRRNDYARAVHYQSSWLKETYPTVEGFRQSIVTNYPQFARYQSIDVERTRANDDGAHVAVRVRLTGQDGVTVKALYMMIREGRAYRVGGVIGGTRPYQPRKPSSSGNSDRRVALQSSP